MKRARIGPTAARDAPRGAPMRVEHETVDWEMHRGDEVFGIRDRDVRERVHAICHNFAKQFGGEIERRMQRLTWDRRTLSIHLKEYAGVDLPTDELLAVMPDKWVASGSLKMQKSERRMFGNFIVDHLVQGIAAGNLDDSDMLDHAQRMCNWFVAILDESRTGITIHLNALAECVRRMVYVLRDGRAILQPNARDNRVVSTVDDAVTLLTARPIGVIRLSPADPQSRLCRVWIPPTGGLAIMVDEPVRDAMLGLVANVTQASHDQLMTERGKPRCPIAVHAWLSRKRELPASTNIDTDGRLAHDVTACLSHRLVNMYRENPEFDSRPREAIVDAVIRETQAMPTSDRQCAVVNSWMAAGLGIQAGPALNGVLDLLPSMRREMHHADAIALLVDSNQRTRDIQKHTHIIQEQNKAILEELAEAKARAERAILEELAEVKARAERAEMQHAQLANQLALMQASKPVCVLPTDPYVEMMQHLFVVGTGKMKAVDVANIVGEYVDAHPNHGLEKMKIAQCRGEVLRQRLGAVTGRMRDGAKAWIGISLRT